MTMKNSFVKPFITISQPKNHGCCFRFLKCWKIGKNIDFKTCLSSLWKLQYNLMHYYQYTQQYKNTLFEIFIFCPKIQLWFPEKIVDFFLVKISWNCCGFGLFSCWQLWFHEKIVKKIWGEKLVKMLWFWTF